jgi:HK97 family phage major capsid protein
MAEKSLTDVREEMGEKARFLFDVSQQAGPDLDMSKVTLISGDSQYKVGEINRLQTELSELGRKHDQLHAASLILDQNKQLHKRLNEPQAEGLPTGTGTGADGHYNGQPLSPRRLREVLQTNKSYKAFRDGTLRTVTVDIPAADFKTLVSLTTVGPQNERRPLVPMAMEERTVADLMLQGNTGANTIEYYEETTFTVGTAAGAPGAAGPVAEGQVKGELTVGFTLRTESIRKIAQWVPATKEALDDVDFLESQLRGRLAFAVVRAEEQQILSGSGVAPQIAGLLGRSGIQTQAKGADPTPDAIYRGMQKIRGAGGAGFAEPSAVVFHPNDWTDIKLLRTADGIYIWGNPSDEGPDRIWGLPVRQTTAMTEGTALVGAFRPHAEVIRREGLQITLSTEHASFFVENKVAILAEERLGLAVYRPSAFCTVTGI